MCENEGVSDMLYRSKIRIDNPGACAREYNSIMQIIMETLIGWDFKLEKQTILGIFGEVLGLGDATEEQEKKHFILMFFFFVAGFDRLISMLWSDSEDLRKKTEGELTGRGLHASIIRQFNEEEGLFWK
jgi:hypothetical protein